MTPDFVDLWRTQSELLHKQLGHLLLIRGWAASLTAALVVGIASSDQPVIAAGGAVLVAFWYTEYVYAKFLDAYAARESGLRHALARTLEGTDASSAMALEVTYRRGLPRLASYATMLAVLLTVAGYVAYR